MVWGARKIITTETPEKPQRRFDKTKQQYADAATDDEEHAPQPATKVSWAPLARPCVCGAQSIPIC